MLQEKLNSLIINFKEKNESLINHSCTIKSLEKAIKIASLAPSGANQQPWTYCIITQEEIKQKLLKGMNNKQIIAVFKQNHGILNNQIIKHYYAHDSVSLSLGMLLGAFKYAHIQYEILPNSDKMNEILNRPNNETLLMLLLINGSVDKMTVVKNHLDEFYEVMKTRRSIRSFETKSFDKKIIENMIDMVYAMINSSGYHFEIVFDKELKKSIRNNAEENEKRLYEKLMTAEWKNALSPLGTNWEKKHLTEAPYLVVVFYDKNIENSKTTAGIATGIFIQMLHYIGLSTLTYTPNPMKFLNQVLNISKTPMMVLPIGYPNKFYILPHIKRKDLNDILLFM